MAQITTFGAMLILIITEAVQEAMISGDQSMTNALLLVTTLLGFDVLLAILSIRSPFLERLINGAPVLLVNDGQVYDDAMTRTRVSQDDAMEHARFQFGIERFEQIKYAVLERNDSVTVIPRQVGWELPQSEQSDQ